MITATNATKRFEDITAVPSSIIFAISFAK